MEPVVWTVEGSAVYGQYHAAEARKSHGGVLLMHGFNSSHQEFGDLASRLAQSGFDVLSWDQRGFGASGGEPGRIGLDRVMAETEVALETLTESLPRKAKIAAVGHSMGGSYALGIQARQGVFDALVVAHVVDRLFDELRPTEKPLFHAMGQWTRRRLRKGKGALYAPYRIGYRDILVDKQARALAQEDGFLENRVNLGNYDFATTMQASDWAAKVTCPVLCVQSPEDKAVDPGRSEAVYQALAGPSDRLAHAGGHSCFRDVDREMIAGAVVDWLAQQLGGRR